MTAWPRLPGRRRSSSPLPARQWTPRWCQSARRELDCLGKQYLEPLSLYASDALLEEPPCGPGDQAGFQWLAGRADLGRHSEQHNVAHLVAEEPAAATDEGALGLWVSGLALEREVRPQQAPQLRVATLPGRPVSAESGDHFGDPLRGHWSTGTPECLDDWLDLPWRDAPASGPANGVEKLRCARRRLLSFSRDRRHTTPPSTAMP